VTNQVSFTGAEQKNLKTSYSLKTVQEDY